jgi:PAS domain-containing protein
MNKPARRKTSHTLHLALIAIAACSIPLYVMERVKSHQEKTLFAEALEAADAGRWYWDLKTGELLWDDHMFRLFGKSKSSWTQKFDSLEASIHPEDVERVKIKIDKAIAERGGYHDTFRIITESGEVREIRASALVSKNRKYMTGLNLPVKPREGNFIRDKSYGGYGIPSLVRKSEDL